MSGNYFTSINDFLAYGVDMLAFTFAGVGCFFVLMFLLTLKATKPVVFPFLDELEDLAKKWREARRDKTAPQLKMEEVTLAIAFSVVTGFTILAIMWLVAQLITPLA